MPGVFQPKLAACRAATLLIAAALASPAPAQTADAEAGPGAGTTLAPVTTPVTTPALTPVTAPARSSGFDLGDCPDDLLRQAWLEEQPLQMAAVEAEVLALCTERAEAIAGFLRTRALQDAALGRLQGSRTSPPVAPRAPATAPTSGSITGQ